MKILIFALFALCLSGCGESAADKAAREREHERNLFYLNVQKGIDKGDVAIAHSIGTQEAWDDYDKEAKRKELLEAIRSKR
jgi:hypothetical protein